MHDSPPVLHGKERDRAAVLGEGQGNLHARTAWGSRRGAGHGRVAQSRTEAFRSAHCSSVKSPAQRGRGRRQPGHLERVVMGVGGQFGHNEVPVSGRRSVGVTVGALCDGIQGRAGVGRRHGDGQAGVHDGLSNVAVLALTSD